MLFASCLIASLLTFFHPCDDYYSSRNGKFLGRDGSPTRFLRLIDEQDFDSVRQRWGSTQTAAATAELSFRAKYISADNDLIQHDLQLVRDLSMSGRENQLYIILDLRKARISSIMSRPGTNSTAYFEYFSAPGLGANMPVGPDNRRMTFTVILAGVHGHPDSEIRSVLTLPTMSPDHDAVVAHNRQLPIYGIDAMSTTGLPGTAGKIHRANPDGSIDNNVGWTKGRGPGTFDIARDALERWGKSGTPKLD